LRKEYFYALIAYAHQGCIYLIKDTVKQLNCGKYYYHDIIPVMVKLNFQHLQCHSNQCWKQLCRLIVFT